MMSGMLGLVVSSLHASNLLLEGDVPHLNLR